MLLKEITKPSQLKKLNLNQLESLASEIRQELISVVSNTGGHLASNLGVVELTLAFHYVFNSPVDKVIWDVGHQSYVHKMLTGRYKKLSTIRQWGGLSGFPKREESVYDAFNTGHSSTSISAALGMALARDLKKTDEHIVAVIGDGALTGGMALEAINHAGDLKTRLIVILNDNEMSIANNVGAMSSYLSRIRSSPKYYQKKKSLVRRIKQVPAVGSKLYLMAEKLKGSLKHLLVPGMLFEELGFTYLGPIDGHNLNSLITVFQQAQNFNEPVLIHVITKKGKGYQPAEDNPDDFHGVGSFNLKTGKSPNKTGPPTYTEVFGKSLVQLAKENEKIIGITAAMPDGTGLKYLAKEIPERFFDVGIAEQHAVTLAAGLACQGFRPIVAIYSTFLQRAYDQLIHDICLQNLPVIFVVDRAGLVGQDGETHHGLFDLSFLRPIPNLTLLAPKDELELSQMLTTSLNQNCPIAIRFPRGKGVGVDLENRFQPLTWGRSEILLEGDDLLILTAGPIAYEALKAATVLRDKDINCQVINTRFLKPLDEKILINEIQRIKKVITVEENVLAGGFGSAIREMIGKEGLENIQLVNLALPDIFIQHGDANFLREKYGLSAEGILDIVERNFYPRKANTNVYSIK